MCTSWIQFVLTIGIIIIRGISAKEISYDCEGLEIVTRKQWRARNAVREREMNLPVNHIVILHTVTAFCKKQVECMRQVQLIQDLHLDERETLVMNKISFIIFLGILCISTPLKDKRDCDGVEIVWREDWKARPIVHNKTLVLPVNKVIIAHTVTTFCSTKPQCIRNIQMIQDFSMDYNGMFDISYNFLIGGDGRVYEGGGWRQVGSHTIKYNYISIGIGFIGNYNIQKPSQKVIDAALNLIDCGVKQGFLTPTREIHGHRDVICTESPGNNLYSVIRYWKNYKGGRIPNYSCM